MTFALGLFWPSVALVVGLVYMGARLLRVGMREEGLPPGPPTLPILGNLHQMTDKPYLMFEKWAKQYGPIMSVKLGTQTMIVINTEQGIRDLFEKRSGNYSAKASNFGAEFGENLNLLFRTNDDVWRRMRKMYHLRLNITAANNYLPYQEFESLQMLDELLDRPQDFWTVLKRYTTSIGATVIFAKRYPDLEDPRVKALYTWLERFSALMEKTSFADWYPILKPFYFRAPSWISGFLKEAAELKEMETKLWMQLIGEGQEMLDQGKMRPSFARNLLLTIGAESGQIAKSDALTFKQIAFVVGHAWPAAADTTYSTLMGFVKAMVLFPEVQKQAQEELDRVVGSYRLPTWEDSPNLPYIMACVKESFRWMPTTVAGGAPHAATNEDSYLGYRIPAGVPVVNNVWSINNDRTTPRDFEPRRHLPGHKFPPVGAPIGSDTSDKPYTTFGAGRRMCPGIHVAERSLYTAVARLLWSFNMKPAVDEKGNVVPIDRDGMTPGFMVTPVHYNMVFESRDEERVALIRRSWKQAKSFLEEDGSYNEAFFQQSFATQSLA
ncbi:hypothetical protein Z517_05768 [Fonsecaea pedrosoi CBS 271.37]|uniref:Cytochrome P450 n=1 Tax=Fonsecaea pedrosoi CBS 271.37 TaxID=1442368 RepID=A0A0D2DN78_9EURO|nr:uncharacterized protein Z517_05768 [Fonsecaea pedrosoi CBS 271.37]KIW79156.1 hypothetical protein Z517_05768 [Fonsecaea pedrosoi CBS 271.37]